MLIGVTGLKRNGKDSVANVLVKNFGFKKVCFAQKMKECAEVIFGWDQLFIEANKEKVSEEWGISPRQFLQVIGTEFAQFMLCDKYPAFKETTGRKIWAKATLKDYKDEENWVVSDVRFPHEVEEIRKRGGIVVKVIGGYKGCPEPDLSHESESSVQLINPNVKLTNNGTLKDLEKLVNVMYNTITKGGTQ